MELRETTEEELSEFLDVHRSAFSDEGEVIADLVNSLLKDSTAHPLLSLAAYEDSRMLGHILFTKATISGYETNISAQLLAPLAVIPEAQSKGLGQMLINEGVAQLRKAGVDLVFVLGHPTYYPRCGFAPAGVQGLEAPYPIPDKDAGAWMVQELKTDVIGSIIGKLQCAEALDQPEYWRE